MPKIELRKGEDLERALRKFKTKLRHEGVMDEMKKRESYEKPSERKRRELEEAVRREHRRKRDAD
ncbi:MAG: 30S ribosomal protein S21 [Candidatus Margulisbacteria bacterium]|jgi:small subunit ribosomal protein S21|nr:30S ribosomal protein S21 [Candidatus Margulisiibacteriota bacterium]